MNTMPGCYEHEISSLIFKDKRIFESEDLWQSRKALKATL